MKFGGTPLAGLAIALAFPASAGAVTTVLNANLLGANEIPARVTPGTGSATLTFDDTTNILNIQSAFSGLLGPTVAAHVHCCSAPTANSPVVTTVPAFAGFPLGVTSGTYSGSLDLTLASSFNPSYLTANGGSIDAARSVFIAGLLNNQAYFNIHSTVFPGGEIRGQLISAVPEPTTWAMMVFGFGAVGYSVRRRRATTRLV